ncbi:hypothetical protein [Photobacterium kishitanii]|uniref:Uncharacterized protein n=1 Tax=Photobacterium kishitanii TaxID=318456 RepID=A0A2T3KDW4_9GAMM|nr:hypothetical protein [Photobacterium kishitanii]PSU95090.1 hypothetical protein C9J27_19020 [Photobacterium kishitanii]
MKKNEELINCFVIMPISDQDGYENGHFQYVYEDIIKPAIELANMNPIRADETKNTNLIQLDILKNVIQSSIAICDMSSKNPNVFYELGLRQAFDLPTVLLKDDITEAPFDINGLRYCNYNHQMKHRDVKSAIDKLSEMLIDTYSKKDNKAEVNSLIRLLELASPAEVPQNSMSGKEREEAQIRLKLDTLIDSVNQVQKKIQIIEGGLALPLEIKPERASAASGLLRARNELRARGKLITPIEANLNGESF